MIRLSVYIYNVRCACASTLHGSLEADLPLVATHSHWCLKTCTLGRKGEGKPIWQVLKTHLIGCRDAICDFHHTKWAAHAYVCAWVWVCDAVLGHSGCTNGSLCLYGDSN